MKKYLLMTALAFPLVFAGCTSTQVQQLDQTTANIVQGVQEVAAQVCKFIPEAGAIVSLFNATIGSTVNSVAEAICASVPKPTSEAFKALPSFNANGEPAPIGAVNGIQIKGWRVP